METKGLPLDFMLMSLDYTKYTIDWIELFNTAIEHNWSMKSTFLKIESSLIDVYGRNEYSETIIFRLSKYMEILNNE